MKPRILDLFCGAGGAATGYARAGFEVVGVDIELQPNYPFEFIETDAIEFLERIREFATDPDWQPWDAIHASPPCQAYSAGARMRNGFAKDHPRLIEPVRELLLDIGWPYVIENVPEAPLLNPVKLCGSNFGLAVRRHRHFECSFPVMVPPCTHAYQEVVVGVYGDHPEDSVIRKGHPAIRAKSVEHAQESMGIDWMPRWSELKEAIPPAMTEHIGSYLLAHLEHQSREPVPSLRDPAVEEKTE